MFAALGCWIYSADTSEPCAHAKLMTMKTWEPRVGEQLLREIGDVNDVDRCQFIKHHAAFTSNWILNLAWIGPSWSRSSWWFQLQPFNTQPAEARIMPHLLQAGYDGRHLADYQLTELVRLAVLFDDVELAAFTHAIWKASRPAYPPAMWRDVFRDVDFLTLARSDGLHSIDSPAHIWRRLQTIRRLNQMVGDTFRFGLVNQDLVTIHRSAEYVIRDIPLYRIVDANCNFIKYWVSRGVVQNMRESAHRVLHIKQTLYELAMGDDPAHSKQRRTFRGPVRGGTTLWMVPALVDIVLAYDSQQSECELDCARRTLAMKEEHEPLFVRSASKKRARE